MKKLFKGIIAVSICLGLTACGSKSSDSSAMYDSPVKKSASNTAGAVDSFDSYDYAATEAAAYDDVAYEEAAEELAIDDNSDTSSGDSSNNENTTNKLDVEKLIYRCNISLETLRFNDTVNEFQKLITKYDGFIESENTYIDGSVSYGSSGLGVYTATVRVPSSKYKDFVNETGGIGTLTNKSQNVTNVSQEYSDLSVEMEVLEAQKQDYMEMLKEAKKLEDMDNVILISDKIASVSTRINQIKTRLNTIDNDVAYSYVDINIREVKEIVEHTEETFGTRFTKEVKQGWYDFGYGFQNFIIWIVANIWGLLIFFGIIFLIIFIIRKIIKKAKKRKEEKLARMYPGYNPQAMYAQGKQPVNQQPLGQQNQMQAQQNQAGQPQAQQNQKAQPQAQQNQAGQPQAQQNQKAQPQANQAQQAQPEADKNTGKKKK
ncbi:protein of unknown function [Lachnospiraceae bacterium]|nr:protein of unknown function [Lachnospiraceae bacterium]